MSRVHMQRPQIIWLSLVGFLTVAILLFGAWAVITKYRQATAKIAQIEPRYARIAGLLQGTEQITAAEAAVSANLANYVYSADGDAGQVGNSALQQIRELASKYGLRVSSSQASTPRTEGEFERIGLTLRIEGKWSGMAKFLQDISQQRPFIFYENLAVSAQRVGAIDAPPAMVGQFEFYVLKESHS